MTEPRMQVTVAEDLSAARLSLLPASGLTGDIDLTLEQLGTLIARLGEARAAMLAPYPVPPIDGVPIKPVYKTNWTVQLEALTEGSMIAFQHPCYGPIGFVLPPADTERVVRTLTNHLGMVHPSGRTPS